MCIPGDVRESLGAAISQQAHFAAVFGFTNRDEVEKSILVVIHRGNSPPALPAELWQRHALQFFSVHVAPQTDSRRAVMCERQIHPAVFIEIKGHYADRRRQIFFFEIDRWKFCKFAFARVQINCRSTGSAGEDKIDGAIVVEVGGNHARATGDPQCSFRGHVGKGAVAIISPQNVMRGRRSAAICRRSAGSDIQIQIAVVVVVHESYSHTEFFLDNSHLVGEVRKFTVARVPQQPHTVLQANCKIRVPIIIEIAGRASHAAPAQIQSRLLSYVREAPVTQIVQQSRGSFGIGAHQQKVRLAVTVIIEKTRAGARPDRIFRCARRFQRRIHRRDNKMHRRGRRHLQRRIGNRFRYRIFSLVAISRAQRRAQVLRGDFLKFCQVFLRGFGIAFALVGARQLKFGGSVVRREA